MNAFGHTTVSNGIDLSFLGGIYGTYLIFGYMVYKESSVNLIKKYSLKKYFLLAAGVFFIITVLTCSGCNEDSSLWKVFAGYYCGVSVIRCSIVFYLN